MKFDAKGKSLQCLGMMRGNQMFVMALSGLGLMGLLQVLIGGMALAVRLEEGSRVQVVEREVERIVPIRIRVPAPQAVDEYVAPKLPPMPEAEAVDLPTIGDPVSKRLFKEGRKARIAGDMGLAIVKLKEALEGVPDDATVLFELGMVHEMMGVFNEASHYYERVFQAGVSGAGGLYVEAAGKLRDGFEMPTDMLGKVALGRVRIFKDRKAKGGARVILTVPVEKASGEDVDSQKIEVEVLFFNKTNKGQIVQLEDNSWAVPQWVSLPFDWVGGEESLRVTYQIPQRDLQMAHLFGKLEYYGQVVTLKYKGEVLDVQAWPRDLSARMERGGSLGNDFPEFLNQDVLPPNFDPDIPLLNPLVPE